jgi:hypothetical protein
VEQPSLLKTVLELPGTLLRLPGSVVAALDAIPDVADRLDRLTVMVERMGAPMGRAGSGVDLAASGIATAVSGLEQAFGSLDTSLPFLSDSASVLRGIRERLGFVAGELNTELPEATNPAPDGAVERPTVVGRSDQSLPDLDAVVTELAGLMETIVGAIPGVRRGSDETNDTSDPNRTNGTSDPSDTSPD